MWHHTATADRGVDATNVLVTGRTTAADEYSYSAMAPSIVDLFWDRVRSWPKRTALRRHGSAGWESVTWRDYGDAVTEVAAGLIHLGLDPGDRVGILSANQVRWHVADMAVLSAAATSVPAYATSAAGQVEYVLRHSGSRACFVGDRDQLAKVLLRRHRLPALEHVIVFDDIPDGLDDGFVIRFDDLRAFGRDRLVAEPDAVQLRVASIAGDSIATIVYTSGTTGPPKGALISHGNISATVHAVTTVIAIGPDDRFLSFLPLSHIAERMVSHFGQIVSGGETWFARSLSTVVEDLRDCRPTIFFAVPRVWEKLHVAICEAVASSPRPVRLLAESYLGAATAHSSARRGDSRYRLWDRGLAALLDPVVGARMRGLAGLDAARFLVSGAAPIDPGLLWWFSGIGLEIAEVYGQTEDCGPTSVNPPGAIRIGSAGVPLPGVDVRIAPDQEILVRGPTVSAGYHNDPDRTRELIDPDGWMHSGDLGRLDEDGYLYVTGRKKDLIITSSGKNIAPQPLETHLQAEPLISQAVVIGDGHPYLTALLGLDGEAVARWAAEHGKIADFEGLLGDPDLHATIDASIERANAGRAPIEQIKMWRIIPRELSVGANELTPTLKVRRELVSSRFGSIIEEMYATAHG